MLKKTQSIVEKAFQEGSQVTINPLQLGKSLEQTNKEEDKNTEPEKSNDRDAPRSGKDPKAPLNSKDVDKVREGSNRRNSPRPRTPERSSRDSGDKRKRTDDEDRQSKKIKSEVLTTSEKEVQVEDENDFSLKSSTTFVPTSDVPIPPDVQRVQAYLIMLVAAMVKLEKRRKRRSYEDFLAEDDDGSGEY